MPLTPPGDHTPAYAPTDLTTCDTEPIHVPGAIQPHGVLLALTEDAAEVVMASVNAAAMLGIAADDVVGRPLADVLGPEAAAQVERRVVDGLPVEPLLVRLEQVVSGELAGRECDLRVHRSGSRTVVEVEALEHTRATPMTYQSARSAMSRLSGTTTVTALTDQIAREVRALTGFDRVMVYRFDEEWNGEVVAEDRRPDLNPFLGLHYPASDIPAQARRLYTVNWLRLIADISYVPVPLTPVLDPATGTPLDLSHSSLRSVSPMHVEYLSHMGVTASMSVSLVVDGELWGLVACHHYSGPHRPPLDARSASEFLAHVASPMIADRERADDREAALATQALLAEITARVSASPEPPLDAMLADPALLALMNATGLAMNFDGSVRTLGKVPDVASLRRMADLTDHPERYAIQTSHLAGLDPAFAELAPVASGVLRIGASPERWLMWLRPELEQVVDWGGDPTNKQLAAAEGPHVRLSPRRSFEQWRQVVRGQSQVWAPWEVEAADVLGRHINGLLLLRSREQIALAESLQRQVVLDRAPDFDGVELVASYEPASSNQLGGDWWDAFELAPGRLALVIGDVAGHGVSAASAMTQVRTALRAYLFEGHSPGVCLDHLDHLMDGLLDVRVATAVVAVLDVASGEVEIANAGHPPPLLAAPGSAVELAGEVRPLLGVGEGRAEPVHLVLPVGSTLLLYTDGLIERRGSDMAERTGRLHAITSATTADEPLEALLARVLAMQGDSEADDTTVLAVRRT
ncbi:SpoIIE family protein phosphatase [Nocardioides sp. cx-169]|uniref:SpoIIE family protein phosphatase n=1 Tax=Nocardioides sp. cx-169 TaxID=2899080 RepID=UPI001E2E484E|nr:SpoIIE family protein phosphatase [Nocardioides sp. cx-169]MCD4532668.1 SpoIIE family protein phosphatase [Nocardioides sp. cx-169]